MDSGLVTFEHLNIANMAVGSQFGFEKQQQLKHECVIVSKNCDNEFIWVFEDLYSFEHRKVHLLAIISMTIFN